MSQPPGRGGGGAPSAPPGRCHGTRRCRPRLDHPLTTALAVLLHFRPGGIYRLRRKTCPPAYRARYLHVVCILFPYRPPVWLRLVGVRPPRPLPRRGPGRRGGPQTRPRGAGVTSRRGGDVRVRAVTPRRHESRGRDAAAAARGRPPGSAASGTRGRGDADGRTGGRPPFSARFSPGGGPGPRRPPELGRRGKTALSALLRCFPCERLCGGCTVPPAPPRPPGALPPAAAPRRRLPPAARLPPRTFRSYLPRSHRTYSCVHCRAHLARHEELISKSFQGSHGRAYLFNSVVNVSCGPAEQRLLLTGLHSVADIFCESCKTTLGWKYEQAFESSQKYKEGKFIIEMSHMVKENGWD
ncbi:protein yippee-like 4 [Rhea pennata]|uniref:protein yippee-like 4 n=1 Tax=Rhea pennata TaxID=8795 RepID=UPI002E2702A9